MELIWGLEWKDIWVVMFLMASIIGTILGVTLSFLMIYKWRK